MEPGVEEERKRVPLRPKTTGGRSQDREPNLFCHLVLTQDSPGNKLRLSQARQCLLRALTEIGLDPYHCDNVSSGLLKRLSLCPQDSQRCEEKPATWWLALGPPAASSCFPGPHTRPVSAPSQCQCPSPFMRSGHCLLVPLTPPLADVSLSSLRF